MEPEIDTKPTGATLSKAQAVELNKNLAEQRAKVRYLKHFDTDRIWRQGNVEESTITKPRITEDDRPALVKGYGTDELKPKQIDVITYAENDTLYVLAKSGGVSLFDGMPAHLKMSKNKRWYCCFVSRTTPIPEGLLLAKNVNMGRDGLFHYAFHPAYDMTLAEFRKKLKELDKYMRVV